MSYTPISATRDPYTLGTALGRMFPHEPYDKVVRWALSVQPVDGGMLYNPIEAAYRFMQGYKSASGNFYDAPECNNMLTQEYSLVRARKVLGLGPTIDPISFYELGSSHATMPNDERYKTVATTKTTTNGTPKVSPKVQALLDKQKDQHANDPGGYEENKSGYVNTCQLSGTLGRDIEVQALPSGQILAKGSLGVFNRGVAAKEDKRRTEWVELTMWLQSEDTDRFKANTAKFDSFLELTKGTKLVVTGPMTWRYWQGQDGVEHKVTTITVTDF